MRNSGIEIYLPYGELFVSQKNSSFDSRYKFTAKELDNETNYTYFGARYYDSDLSSWLSVDPLSDKYPSLSPYNYCAGNPVVLVDPDGRKIVLSGKRSDRQKLVSQINQGLSSFQVKQNIFGKLKIVGGNQNINTNDPYDSYVYASIISNQTGNIEATSNSEIKVFKLVGGATDYIVNVDNLSQIPESESGFKNAIIGGVLFSSVRKQPRVLESASYDIMNFEYENPSIATDLHQQIAGKTTVNQKGVQVGNGIFNWDAIKTNVNFDKNNNIESVVTQRKLDYSNGQPRQEGEPLYNNVKTINE
jgi:RHS repeat-associated protein